MRLFGIVDGTIDRRERASWLTCPFDLELGEATSDVPTTDSLEWKPTTNRLHYAPSENRLHYKVKR